MSKSVFIALPAFGYVNTTQTTMSLFNLSAHLVANGYTVAGGALSYPDISDCRNIFLTLWYDCLKHDYMLFVDADMKFGPELILDMLALDKPLVGCVYRKKLDEINWVGEPIVGEQVVIGGFLQAQKLGTGIMLIHRSMVEKMIEKYPDKIFDIPEDSPLEDANLAKYKLWRVMRFFDKIPMGHHDISEDYAFCKRWRDIGGEIWANCSHQVGHVGQKEYSGRLEDQIRPKGS